MVKHGRPHYAKERLPGVSSAVRGESTHDPIAYESRELIDKLLQERLALAGIAPVTGVCEPWLQMYLHQKYYQTPRQVEVSQKKEGSSLFQWMKCGRLWGPRRTRHGWG